MTFNFKTLKKDGKARTGVIYTAHGKIHTPTFMPVGTAATVKAMLPEMINSTQAEIILGNTYHLNLRPSAEVIYELGGLRKFMNWSKPILTDSGGFQIMSLAKLRKVTENGVEFRSHLNGAKHFLTPERATEIQYLLDSTISMVLDECLSYPATYDKAVTSLELSMRWAKRSKNAFKEREGYAQFGIVQGGVYEDLRKKSAQTLQEIGFDGYAIGGLAVGEGQQIMLQTLKYTVPNLDENKPRYLMGVGKPSDLIGAVLQGVDMFDCVLPTRSGRNGQAFTWQGTINIRNAKYKKNNSPLSITCNCITCKNYSMAYLNHLVKTKEILASILITYHNLYFYQNLMYRLRDHINNGSLEKIKNLYELYQQDPDAINMVYQTLLQPTQYEKQNI
ncbi:MAG: tRNA guanosine(34) transglycosylase Tgt [Rickettsiales bacterium]|nr:tRNA guanosine(34) transglycosylase Tgt [Rickettsiales bacterium]